MFSNGKGLINKTIGQFNKIVADLEKGVQGCEEEISMHRCAITEAESQIVELENHASRAKEVATRIRAIIA